MAWRDFREFLAEIERRGLVRTIEGADCHLEIGTLVELMTERNGPMLLFDRIQGYPQGYRIAAKPYSHTERNAVALGLPTGLTAPELFKIWREKVKRLKLVKPVEVRSAPVMENALEDDAVDLMKFPTPKWHEKDGGPYFGTGCAVITNDPDHTWVNVGTYRCMLHDQKTTGIQVAAFHHGKIHMNQWWAKGSSCPVAVAVTTDPYVFTAATMGLPSGVNEYEYAGFIKDGPIEVIKGPRTGLPLPATAELVLEGEIPPPQVEQRTEGPLGEFTGYMAGGPWLQPVIRVRAIYHRTNPILQGEPPLKPPDLNYICPPHASTLSVWEGLENAGIPGIKNVYPLRVGGGLITVIAISQQYDGHAEQVAHAASGIMPNMCRLIIVVDDDIDASNPEDVLWAMATRFDPETSFDIVRNCPSGPLDPIISPEKKRRKQTTASRGLIIACRPWHWKDEFPAVNKATEALRREVYEKWRALFQQGS
jgi:4-hydroxy-3-polyprenylbenzoate decarboxylase